MGRAPCCDKVGLKRGRWTADEDRILINYINQNGEGSWRSMPKNAGLLRCGKSCRLRWINYLRSDLKRGNFSTQEQDIIIKLHASLGNKWSLIANQLPGRTDNEIKNYWNSTLSRRIDTFRRPTIYNVAGVLPQVLTTGNYGSSVPDQLINGPAAAVADEVIDNKVKKKGKGRTSRAAMKKNKSGTYDRSNKSKQVVPQHHAYESNTHIIHTISGSHLSSGSSSSSSSNSSCLSRCHSTTSVGTCSSSVLNLSETPTFENVDHQGLLLSILPAEDVMESLDWDSFLACKNDTKQRPHDADELVDLDAYCTEGVDLSFADNNNNVNFYEKLVIEVDEACGVNSNGINSGGEEMRMVSILYQPADKNTQSSGFEDCALAAGADWEWKNIVYQHANEHNQQWNVNEQDGTKTSWLWDYNDNHQRESNVVDKNQKDEEHIEAVVAWLLS